MEQFEDYDVEYLRDQAILQEERRIRMEVEWQKAEYYRQKNEEQLPAKIEIFIKTSATIAQAIRFCLVSAFIVFKFIRL